MYNKLYDNIIINIIISKYNVYIIHNNIYNINIIMNMKHNNKLIKYNNN